jgi:hypothetical protein
LQTPTLHAPISNRRFGRARRSVLHRSCEHWQLQ